MVTVWFFKRTAKVQLFFKLNKGKDCFSLYYPALVRFGPENTRIKIGYSGRNYFVPECASRAMA